MGQSYDAEGRICAVYASNPVLGASSMTGYLYDADGIRVAKGSISAWSCDPTANGFTTTNDYILGLGGEQLTEMGMGGTTANGGTTTGLVWQHANIWAGGKLLGTYDKDGLHFYLDDPLGTRRAQTDAAGVLEQTCSSLPFGDGLACSEGDLLAPTENHFTGKERDTESGNDYFGARYYASSMGRFMSPDWSVKTEPIPYTRLDDPQTLNLYAYVENNPMDKVDADGHGSITEWLANAWNQAQNALNKYIGGENTTKQQSSMNIPKDKRIIVVPNIDAQRGHTHYGSTETCVNFAKAFGAPQTSLWTRGHAVDANTPKGTFVGTFYANNGTKFANKSGESHVGALVSVNNNGITLMDQ